MEWPVNFKNYCMDLSNLHELGPIDSDWLWSPMDLLKVRQITLFIKQSEGKLVILVVYVDDIVIMGDDVAGIAALKVHLASAFDIKKLGNRRYILSTEIGHSQSGIFISQRKYILDRLSVTGRLGCRPSETPIKQIHHLADTEGELLRDMSQYQILVGKLL